MLLRVNYLNIRGSLPVNCFMYRFLSNSLQEYVTGVQLKTFQVPCVDVYALNRIHVFVALLVAVLVFP